MNTLYELKELIVEHINPEQLLELLNISTEEIVERFEDKIEARRSLLEREIG